MAAAWVCRRVSAGGGAAAGPGGSGRSAAGGQLGGREVTGPRGWRPRSEASSAAGPRELRRPWAGFRGAGGGEGQSSVPGHSQVLMAAAAQVWRREMCPGAGKMGSNNHRSCGGAAGHGVVEGGTWAA